MNATKAYIKYSDQYPDMTTLKPLAEDEKLKALYADGSIFMTEDGALAIVDRTTGSNVLRTIPYGA